VGFTKHLAWEFTPDLWRGEAPSERSCSFGRCTESVNPVLPESVDLDCNSYLT